SGGPRKADPTVAPLHKAFQGVKLRQTQGVVKLGGGAVAVFGPLPELAPVGAAGEHRPVLLRLVAEDGELLALQVVGRQRHHPLDLVRLPLLPGPAVEPDLEHLALLATIAARPEAGVGTG